MQLLTSQLINKIICSLGRFYFLPAWRIRGSAVLVCVYLCVYVYVFLCVCVCVCLHVYFSSCAAKSCQSSFSFCVMQRQQLPREWAKKKMHGPRSSHPPLQAEPLLSNECSKSSLLGVERSQPDGCLVRCLADC